MGNDTKISFGWDLAGYGTSGSAFCRAVRTGHRIDATILMARCICRPSHKMVSSISQTVKTEVEMLRRCARIGSVFVDVPIDLQTLSTIVDYRNNEEVRYYWQLVKRPVDQVFSALESLASNLGFATARIANILGQLAEHEIKLGANLFETYPAATLSLLGKTDQRSSVEAYKGGRAEFRGGKWHPLESQKVNQTAREREDRKNRGLATLASRLAFQSDDGFAMDDDEFDSVLCGVTGCITECWMSADRLANYIQEALTVKFEGEDWSHAQPPSGYVLFDKLPSGLQIHIGRVECSSSQELLAAIASKGSEQ